MRQANFVRETPCLAKVWLYLDTQDIDKVAGLVRSIFWLVILSLLLFISLPILLRSGQRSSIPP
jgi:hypothetical protein